MSYQAEHRGMRFPYKVELMRAGKVVGRAKLTHGSITRAYVQYPGNKEAETMSWPQFYAMFRPAK